MPPYVAVLSDVFMSTEEDRPQRVGVPCGFLQRRFDEGDLNVSEALAVCVIETKTSRIADAFMPYTYDDAGQPGVRSHRAAGRRDERGGMIPLLLMMATRRGTNGSACSACSMCADQ